MVDVRELAATLVAEISDAVHKRYQPRRGVLVPPRLNGRFGVPTMKAGEHVMDHADDLLETECETWPETIDPEVYLDLIEEDGRWLVEWVVESGTGEGGEDGAG